MRVSVEADFKALEDMIGGTVRRLSEKSLGEFMTSAGADILLKDTARQFAKGGSPDAWTPLAPSTIKAKEYAGYPRLNRKGKAPISLMQNGAFGPQNILIRRGDLRAAWADRSSPDNMISWDGTSLVVGPKDSIKYWKYHQSSEPRIINPKTGKAKLPQRPLVLTSEALSDVRLSLLRFILTGDKKNV